MASEERWFAPRPFIARLRAELTRVLAVPAGALRAAERDPLYGLQLVTADSGVFSLIPHAIHAGHAERAAQARARFFAALRRLTRSPPTFERVPVCSAAPDEPFAIVYVEGKRRVSIELFVDTEVH